MAARHLRIAKDLFDRSFIPDLTVFLLKPLSHRISGLDVATARAQLAEFSPCPDGIVSARHSLIEPFRYDLQIIVNVYNLEKYIRDCVESILSQKTAYSWHLILVDDGSTDTSPEILDAYAAADSRVQVIRQKNAGPSSKNAGLEEINAAYIMFVDGDDMLEQGAIQAMLEEAYRTDADIVQIGYSRLEDGRLCRQRNVKKTQEAPPYGVMTGFAWGKVIRSSLFETIQFPPGFWHSDTIMAFLIHSMAEKRIMLRTYGYVYRCSAGRLSKRAPLKPKCADTWYITEYLMKEHATHGLAFDSAFCDELMRQVLLNAKRMRKVPFQIKEAVFVLTAELFDRYFEREGIQPTIHLSLRKALLKRDYGLYRLYCRTHF